MVDNEITTNRGISIPRLSVPLAMAITTGAFLCGAAVNIGGKLNSLDNLGAQVTRLEKSIDNFNSSYRQDLKDNQQDLTNLKARVMVLEEQVHEYGMLSIESARRR